MNILGFAQQQIRDYIISNPYPGRGLVIGRNQTGDVWFQVYWIMGRSASSQRRRLVAPSSGVLRTEVLEDSVVDNPSLLVYDAMLESLGVYIVGNGNHTNVLADSLRAGGTFVDAVNQCEREPDSPHFTPRILALLSFNDAGPTVELGILKANPSDPQLTDRFTYRPAFIAPGLGLSLTTYAGDGTPLPSFRGDPLILPCSGSAEEVVSEYWNALNPEYRVAIAVKAIPVNGSPSRLVIKNKY